MHPLPTISGNQGHNELSNIGSVIHVRCHFICGGLTYRERDRKRVNKFRKILDDEGAIRMFSIQFFFESQLTAIPVNNGLLQNKICKFL